MFLNIFIAGTAEVSTGVLPLDELSPPQLVLGPQDIRDELAEFLSCRSPPLLVTAASSRPSTAVALCLQFGFKVLLLVEAFNLLSLPFEGIRAADPFTLKLTFFSFLCCRCLPRCALILGFFDFDSPNMAEFLSLRSVLLQLLVVSYKYSTPRATGKTYILVDLNDLCRVLTMDEVLD